MSNKHSTYVGADLHKKFTCFVAQDKRGKEQRAVTIPNDGDMIRRYLETLPGPVIVAVESTSNWAWFCEEVKAGGHEVVVAHAGEVRAKAGTKDKTDRKDARHLAYMLRGGLIEKQCWQAPEEVLSNRERLRAMFFYTKLKTACKNRLHSIIIRLNIQIPYKDIFCKRGRAMLRGMQIPEQYKVGVCRCLDTIEMLEKILEEDKDFCRKLAEQDEQIQLLMGIPGVGLLLACVIRYEIGEIERFDRPESIVNYAGLAPGRRQSAESDRSAGITKEGAFWLRLAVVQAAQTSDRAKGRLSVFFWRQYRKNKNRNKAIVATAREMLVIIYYIMKRRQGYYEPLALSKRYSR